MWLDKSNTLSPSEIQVSKWKEELYIFIKSKGIYNLKVVDIIDTFIKEYPEKTFYGIVWDLVSKSGVSRNHNNRHDPKIFSQHLNGIRKSLSSYCRTKITRLEKEDMLERLATDEALTNTRGKVIWVLESKMSLDKKIAAMSQLLEAILWEQDYIARKEFLRPWESQD